MSSDAYILDPARTGALMVRDESVGALLRTIDAEGRALCDAGETPQWDEYDLLVSVTTWLASERPERDDAWLCDLALDLAHRLMHRRAECRATAELAVRIAPTRIARLIRAAMEISENAVYEVLTHSIAEPTLADVTRSLVRLEQWLGGGRESDAEQLRAERRARRDLRRWRTATRPCGRPVADSVGEWQHHARMLLALSLPDEHPSAVPASDTPETVTLTLPVSGHVNSPYPLVRPRTTSYGFDALMRVTAPSLYPVDAAIGDHIMLPVGESLMVALITRYAGSNVWLGIEPGVIIPTGALQQAAAVMHIGAHLAGRVRSVCAVLPLGDPAPSISNLDAEQELREFIARHHVEAPVTWRHLPAVIDPTTETVSAPATSPRGSLGTPEALLGIATCTHLRAQFVVEPNQHLIENTHLADTARLSCPDCHSEALAAIPLHRIFPEQIAETDAYVAVERARARLRGEEPVETIEELIARDGRVSPYPPMHLPPDRTPLAAGLTPADTFFA